MIDGQSFVWHALVTLSGVFGRCDCIWWNCDIWCIYGSRPYGDVGAAFCVTLSSVTLYVVMTAHAY